MHRCEDGDYFVIVEETGLDSRSYQRLEDRSRFGSWQDGLACFVTRLMILAQTKLVFREMLREHDEAGNCRRKCAGWAAGHSWIL